MGSVLALWGLACLAAVGALVALSGRLGRGRVGGWLVAFGVFLCAVEGPALLFWFALVDPAGDRDGILGLVTPLARGRALSAAAWGLYGAALLGWVAVTHLGGSAWARVMLAIGLLVVAIGEVGTSTLVAGRGFPVPGGTEAGFGWEPIAVGLLAWAAGLALTHRARAGSIQAASPVAPSTRRRLAPRVISTAAIAWAGLYVHNLAELPQLTPVSPENSLTALVWVVLLVVWSLRPGPAAGWLLAAHALVQLIGGAMSVLPLPFLPFVPEQSLHHYGFHVLYAAAQVPVLLAIRADLPDRGAPPGHRHPVPEGSTAP